MPEGMWASGVAVKYPEIIRRVHRLYLEAGADIISTATYQASAHGYKRAGLASSDEEAEQLMAETLALAVDAREEHLKCKSNAEGRPLIAVSLGSIGATLKNFSEYTGDHGSSIATDDIKEFHLQRLQALARCLKSPKLRGQMDLLAIETIPSIAEAEAVVDALDEISKQEGSSSLPPTWLAFTATQPDCIGSGEPIEDAVRVASRSASVFAVGVNCVPLHIVPALLGHVKRVTEKPIVCYPNGQTWTGSAEEWDDDSARVSPQTFADNAVTWSRSGAKIIGGCCKTKPEHIRAVAKLNDGL
ncbi:Homocysteine S-methyltransferase [Martensiomyces pterosporus]|nr:Homocysteine S-methyltransferase [Martensiomyces pterosporus]